MRTLRNLWTVLLDMRRLADGNPPSEETVLREAFFIWKRRGEGDGGDLGDVYAARRKLDTDDDFAALLRESGEAISALDYELQLGLFVVRNVAIKLGVRPTDIGPDTSLAGLHERELMLIVAGVGHDLYFRFNGNYTYARDVAELVRQLWVNEYRANKHCR